MKIGARDFERLPSHLRDLFVRLPNPGRDEVVGEFPETVGTPKPRAGGFRGDGAQRGNVDFKSGSRPTPPVVRGAAGSAARFFYCAKAPKSERNGSKHPTVKPLALMRYLVRLVTPPGGLVLDPFAGSGTTIHAAADEGFRAIGIEREAEYVADIHRRLATVSPRLVA